MKQLFLLSLLYLGIVRMTDANSQTSFNAIEAVLPTQQQAYTVLSNRCNSCHQAENPSKFFTIKNMNQFAKKINRQVFFWERMPKGKENDLTEKEKQILKTWINHQMK